MISKKKLLFFLVDSQNRSYKWNGTKAVTTAAPSRLQQNPSSWKNITLKFATNQKYFSTLRTFTDPIKLIDDGANIIRDRFVNGNGTEEVMYLVMMRSRPDLGLNRYQLEYKSRIDFSKYKDDPRTGVTINLLQDDVFSLIQANENTPYSIECNSSNPAAIKVLFDGVDLQEKLNYVGLDYDFNLTTAGLNLALPIDYINNDGDSVNVINNSVQPDTFADVKNYINNTSNTNWILSFKGSTAVDVTIKGTLALNCRNNIGSIFTHGEICNIYAAKNTDSYASLSARTPLFSGTLYQGLTQISLNYTITLQPNEKLFIIVVLSGYSTLYGIANFNVKTTGLHFNFNTRPAATIGYALRPLDYLQQLVSKITDGKFTADSNFFRNNNKKVRLSGSSIRGFQDAKIQSSFSDFFTSYNVPYCLSLTVRDGVLWIEPRKSLYNNNNELVDLREVSALEIDVATEYIYSSIQIGYTKQIYNQRNGRYEYNCIHNYKAPINNVINQLSLLSKDRTDSFGVTFLMSHTGKDTTDDKGDKEVFNVMVSDDMGTATGDIQTAIVFNINTFMLDAPIITIPTNGSTVYNTNPTIDGTGQPFKTISIYVDGNIDGTTTADADGNWSYTISNPLETRSQYFSGSHSVSATQTDSTSTGPFSIMSTFIVDTSFTNSLIITAPTNNDSLYNNLPLIKGYGKPGDTITVKVDGTTIGTVVPDNSGYWKLQTTAALSGSTSGTAHTISAVSLLTSATNTILTSVVSVSIALLTSLVQNQTIYSGTPLLKGVAPANSTVNIYIDGGIVSGATVLPDASVTADAKGDWSWLFNLDYDLSTRPSPTHTGSVVPLSDGAHVISTTPDDAEVQFKVSGYKLMRGNNGSGVNDFDSIVLDDYFVPAGVDPTSLPDTLGRFLHPESLFNIIDTTPLRCLRNWDSFINSGLFKRAGQSIKFNGAEMNSNLSTSKNGIVINENADIPIDEMAAPFFIPLWLNFTTKVPETFNDIMTGINNVGYISLSYKGFKIYALPIGTMQMKPAIDGAQQWKLLCSFKTQLSTLLQLNKAGLTINLDKNMIYYSDLNPLHLVQYDFTPPSKYNNVDLYSGWFRDRFLNFAENPDYYQKWQKTDPLVFKIITNGTSTVTFKMYDCASQELVNTYTFNAIASPVSLPNILQQVIVDMSAIPEGKYVFVLYSGTNPIAIAERIFLKEKWPDTYLLEYSNSKDKVDYYFSVGSTPSIRVGAFWMSWEPFSETENYEDEMGDYEILRGIPLKKRTLHTEFIPDWMAIKLNQILLLDNCKIENEHIARTNDSKLEKSEDIQGYPMSNYKIDLVLSENSTGKTFLTPDDAGIHTTLLVLDAAAFGQSEGTIDVIEKNQ